MNAFQARLARLALGLRFTDAAKLCDVAVETVRRIEIEDPTVKEATIEKVRVAFEKAGVELISENGGGPGVRIRKSAKDAKEISRQIDALEDKISSMPAPTEPSLEAGMNIMRKAVAKNDLAKLKNRRKRIRSDRSK